MPTAASTHLSPLWASAAGVLAILSSGACSQQDCDYGGSGAIAVEEYRNPEDGTCQSFGGGGGGGTGCGDTPSYVDLEQADRAPMPDWASCYGYCEGLDENACLATPACRAIYDEDCGEGGIYCDPDNISFHGCWGVAPSGPIVGGTCEDLDAYGCSQHDDCIATYRTGIDATRFASCRAEPQGCYADSECTSGNCSAEEECLPPPGCYGVPGDQADPIDCSAVCYGYCEPPVSGGPGNCYEPVGCREETPQCPMGTLPGVENGCWTGFCIPINQCPDDPLCGALGEAACVSNPACSAIYEGVDCSCTPMGCTCSDWTFAICEAVE